MGNQQLQLQMMEEGQNTYIQQREQAIGAIESTINELGSM
jgi:syntaxin 5